MNPYLEHPELWPEVHHLLIGLLAETLNPQLLPTYRAAIEKRVYELSGEEAVLIGIPDVTVERFRRTTPAKAASAGVKNGVAVALPSLNPVTVTLPMPLEMREGYLEIREVATQAVITVIELLSPTNKRPGKGWETYQTKRQAVLASQTHLVEIDLLRSGMVMPLSSLIPQSDYRILVSRSAQRPRADLYAFNLEDAVPTFALPLVNETTEPRIDLYALLNQAYNRAGYAVAIDYTVDPVPPLGPEKAVWVDSLLCRQGLR
jgi:hypothetical protein